MKGMWAMKQGQIDAWAAGRPKRTVRGLALGLAAAALSGCALLGDLPEPTTLDQRLAAIPQADFALAAPVTVRWNDHHVPYIFAENDDDAAYAVGLVQAHLRLGQMEIARRITQGRIAEFAGPQAADIDAVLRTVGLRRSASESVALMPETTLRWVQRFVDGVNAYTAALEDEALPYEFQALRFEREPWTPEDVVAIGRLAGLDVSWFDWISLLPKRGESDWQLILAEATRGAFEDPVSFESGLPIEARGTGSRPAPDDRADVGTGARTSAGHRLAALMLDAKRVGSNSFVVGGSKTDTGAGMIASDPHLGFLLPNLWLIVGLKTPDTEVVGFMAPGLPIFGLGRNRDVAWGGTNLHAASSDLVDVTGLDDSAFDSERHEIAVRAWIDQTSENRLTQYGPVVTDVPLIREAFGVDEDTDLALRWVAHEPSDEVSAFLRLNRVTSFEGFRAAFKGFSVPGQNFVYADADGNVGQIVAARLPRRPNTVPLDLIVTPDEADAHWAAYEDATTLPVGYNPPQGFLATSNNRPTAADIPLGYFFSPSDRFARVSALLSAQDTVDELDLRRFQRDTYSGAAADLLAVLRERIEPEGLTGDAAAVWALIDGWDARYDPESAGALAFERFIFALDLALRPEEGADLRQDGRDSNRFKREMIAGLDDTADAALAAAVPDALTAAALTLETHPTWGDAHRLELQYPLAVAPVVGDKFPSFNLPTGGSSETIWKTGHGAIEGEHTATYGSQARHISDLGDPDANYFVLAGGQDGWLKSSTFGDQIALWQAGAYIRMPLSEALIEAEFPFVTRFGPGE